MNTYQFSFLVFFGSFVFYHVASQTISDAKSLRTDIFTTNAYDSKIRPRDNQSLAVDVYVAFYLLNLNELNEVQETMKTTGFLYVYWVDEQLDWTPASYGGIATGFWPQEDVWKPDVALKNSYTQYKPLGDKSLNVHVSYTGEVEWSPFQVFESTCSMSIKNYPFDEQTCKLEFVAWSYTKSEVFMHGDTKRGIDLSYYEGNPSWDIIDSSMSADFSKLESSITFTLKLKRKPLFPVLLIVFPAILLCLLNIVAFVLPCDGGEKSGYAVTLFLTFVVFLTIVQSTLPANSESISSFSIYLILMTTMSTLIALIVVAENRCNAWDVKETPIPRWVKFLADLGRLVFCRRSCQKTMKSSANKVEDGNQLKKVENSNGLDEASFYKDSEMESKWNHQNMSIEWDGPEDASSTADDEEQYNWKTVIYGIDRFCILVFSIFAVLCNFLFLVITSASN